MNQPNKTFAPVFVRPIQPTDLNPLKALLSELSPGTLYFRFGRLSMPIWSEEQWQDLCSPPEHCANFVATEVTGQGRYSVVGMARLVTDNSQERAEFSLVVADTLQHSGVGRQLMHAMVGEAVRRGLSSIYGDVLPSNTVMLRFCEGLGFVANPCPDDPRIHRMVLAIKTPKPEARSTPASGSVLPRAPLRA